MGVLIRILLAPVILLLCSCERPPDTFPPPEQRPALAESSAPDPSTMMVEMEDPNCAFHIVKDIYEPGSPSWRWTAKQPTLKVLVYATDQVKLMADFSLWDEAFKQTGPLELSFLVNGHLLDKVRYATPGNKHFEKPVPAEWLSTETESIIAIDVDKLYVAPQDGAKFGVILTRIGFIR